MKPHEFLEWIKKTRDFYMSEGATDPDSSTIQRINAVEVEKLTDRFTANSAINETKALLMAWAFYFTMAAVSLNLATLVKISFRPNL
jgi:hypothetical protein